MLRVLLTLLFLFFSLPISVFSINYLFVGDEIPKIIPVSSEHIIKDSDTLKLNDIILLRGIDYKFNSKFKRFELSFTPKNMDSLFVTYTSLPTWLKKKYGRILPEIPPQSKTTNLTFQKDFNSIKNTNSEIDFNGSKSFRFSTSKSGNAGFHQTLDLHLSGQLAENLTLQGTISDRGYNPTYGSSNSRLNELDKINLRIMSPKFTTEIGDISILPNSFNNSRGKKISGIHSSFKTENLHFGMIAARPKGQYRTVSINGILNKQGPYQINSDGSRQSIIPGSEIVWLDGRLLRRGTNDDYIVDYPNGQITFNVNYPIDNRSRIVIDFEPLSSEYKQKYLHAMSSLYSADSSYIYSLDWIREGDDQDENLSQTFSKLDQELLKNSTEDEFVYKSGLISDTLGAYELLVDSLPDTVYSYLGEGLGQYNVHFSFVEAKQGDYLYIGGGQYKYVGKNNGDYLPLILLSPPKQVDYVSSVLQINDAELGSVSLTWKQSRKIANLFAENSSTENDNYYNMSYQNQFGPTTNNIEASYQLKEFGFQERTRINFADYKFNYYIPSSVTFTTNEEMFDVKAEFSPVKMLQFSPSYSKLKYKNQFSADIVSLNSKLNFHKRIEVLGNISAIKTGFLSDSGNTNGNSDQLFLQSKYTIYKDYFLKSSYKKIKRTNNYSLQKSGYSNDEYIIRIGNNKSDVSFQYFSDDTLLKNWQSQLERKRIQFNRTDRVKLLDYRLQLNYQEIEKENSNDASILSRANFTYNDRSKNLQIQSTFMLSNETRFSKGIRYLEVNDGEGDYIFVDSQYVPEAGGDFILVEELLSESADVKRGEKTFSMHKKWKKFNLSYVSNINEELFADQSRSIAWAIPFYSDENKQYLFYKQFDKGSLKAFPVKGGYFLTCNLLQKVEKRYINQLNRQSESFDIDIIFNQSYQKYYLEQKIQYFSTERDQYYYRAGDVNGIAISSKVKKLIANNEYGIQLTYRTAQDDNDENSNLYIALLENRIQLWNQTEFKISSEIYKSDNNSQANSESYLLTNNRTGTKGAIWSLIFRAKLKNEFRINLTIQGRHSDNRQARIFARTEFVAQF